MVINWGHLGEVGYLAQREQLGERLERQGVLSFSVKQATDCLEYALQTMAVQLSVLRMDWSVWRGLGITNRVSPKFAHLLRSDQAGLAQQNSGELVSAQSLRSANRDQRTRLVSSMLRTKIASLLGLSAENVREDRALLEMGLDSLMAVELRNWIEGHLEVKLPISAVMKGQSLAGMIKQICEMIEAGADNAQSVPALAQSSSQPAADSLSRPSKDSNVPWTTEQASQLLENMDQLTDEQVSQLLSQALNQD